MGKILYFSLQEFGHFSIGLSLSRHFRLKYGNRHQVFICVDQNYEKILRLLDPQLNLIVYHDPRACDQNPLDSLWDNLEQLGSLNEVDSSKHLAKMVEDIGEHMMSLKPQLEQVVQKNQFDYILTDHVGVVPYLINKGIPWGLAFSLNFLLFGLPTLPPAMAGIGLDDRSSIQKYLDECRVHFEPYQQRFDQHLLEHDCRPLAYYFLFYESPYLNLYLCPKELCYFSDSRYAGNVNFQAAPAELLQKLQQESNKINNGEFAVRKAVNGQQDVSIKTKESDNVDKMTDTNTTTTTTTGTTEPTSVINKTTQTEEEEDDLLPDEPLPEEIRLRNCRRRSTRKSIDIFNCRPRLPGNWARLDSTISTLEQIPTYKVTDKLAKLEGELIFFSMGSLFCNCLSMMRRMISMLEQLPYRFIVSKGPRGDQLGELPANCDGANFVPQRSVLSSVQLAIHHGGNNTLSECFHFGVPSLVMPLLGDQPDNGERLRDTGLGRVLNPYQVTLNQLRISIAEMLADHQLRERIKRIGERIRSDNGFDYACDQLVEYLKD